MGHGKGSPEKEVHTNTGLSKGKRMISNKQLNLTPKELKEQEQRQPRASPRRK